MRIRAHRLVSDRKAHIPVLLAASLVLVFVASGVLQAEGATSAGTRVGLKKVTVENVGATKVLVTRSGRTLYLFERDRHHKSSCYKRCARYWPPLLTTGRPVALKGVSQRKLGTTRRTDGKHQVTYAGHPLYRYIGDSKAGQTNGQDLFQFGASWYVLGANGKKISGESSSPPPPPKPYPPSP